MSLDTGTISFRAFYLRDDIAFCPADVLNAMGAKAAPDLATAAVEKPSGWVGPDHLLDRDLSPDHCVCGDWLHVQLMQAERKVPESLLKAACKAEEAAELKARGGDWLPRAVRAELKQRTAAYLRSQAQPTLSGVGVWINTKTRMMLAEATTDGKVDWVSPAVKEVTGCLPILATPETAAIKAGVNANDLEPSRFADTAGDAPVRVALGQEFLTFLFWRYERDGGAFRLDVHGRDMGYLLEGPLTFYREGHGAHEVGIRKGNPLNSREAVTCLSTGKLLRKAKFVLAVDDKTWTAIVDDTFCFKSVKLPLGEGATPYEKFVERTGDVVTFLAAWFGLYQGFVKVRSDAKAWGLVAADVREWVTARNGGRSV